VTRRLARLRRGIVAGLMPSGVVLIAYGIDVTSWPLVIGGALVLGLVSAELAGDPKGPTS
jgi:hypothetical protein